MIAFVKITLSYMIEISQNVPVKKTRSCDDSSYLNLYTFNVQAFTTSIFVLLLLQFHPVLSSLKPVDKE